VCACPRTGRQQLGESTVSGSHLCFWIGQSGLLRAGMLCLVERRGFLLHTRGVPVSWCEVVWERAMLAATTRVSGQVSSFLLCAVRPSLVRFRGVLLSLDSSALSCCVRYDPVWSGSEALC